MNTVPILQIESTKSEDTFAAGETLGQILKGGEVIQFVGDLGAGKTTFIKGLAKGLNSIDAVASPSFTISREYRCRDDIVLHHFDFYRLDEPGIMQNEIAELVDDPKAIIAIEWGEIVESALPKEHIVVTLKSPTEESRVIRISMPEEKE